jgi:Fibronectin type III domain
MTKPIRIFALFLFIFFLSVTAYATDLQWDYPANWSQIDGYVVYFNETGEVDAPYHKVVTKAELAENGVNVTYAGFEPLLNLVFGQQYDIWITCYNVAGESGPSNTVQFTRPPWLPMADSLPSGTVIQIPNGSITIQIP